MLKLDKLNAAPPTTGPQVERLKRKGAVDADIKRAANQARRKRRQQAKLKAKNPQAANPDDDYSNDDDDGNNQEQQLGKLCQCLFSWLFLFILRASVSVQWNYLTSLLSVRPPPGQPLREPHPAESKMCIMDT